MHENYNRAFISGSSESVRGQRKYPVSDEEMSVAWN